MNGAILYNKFHCAGTLYDGSYPTESYRRGARINREELDGDKGVYVHSNSDVCSHAAIGALERKGMTC